MIQASARTVGVHGRIRHITLLRTPVSETIPDYFGCVRFLRHAEKLWTEPACGWRSQGHG